MEKKINFHHVFLSVGTAAILLNWFLVWIAGFPFIYCWGGYIAAPLYQSLGLIVLYASIAYIFWFLYRGNTIRVMVGAAVFTAVVELPLLADLLFRAGGSCV